MNLALFALRRPYTLIAVIAVVLLAAVISLQRMPRDIFPSLDVPTIYVAQSYAGLDPAQMEGFLTYYYEYHFLYISGIEHVESKSIQGAAIIKLQFHPGTDMAQAMAETIGYVNRARAFMPPGTLPPFVMRFDAGSVPVGNLVFSSETKSVAQVQDAALNLVRPLFATLPGVSAPPPFGGSARSIVINLKADRLRALNMSPDEIVTAISQANLISPSGNVTLGDKYPMVPVNAVVKNIKDLEDVPIRTASYPTVFLRDVGEVIDGSDITTGYALVNGRRTVYIPVTKRADASTLSVVDLIKENLPKFQSVLPDDIKVSYEFDQSPVVKRAINDLIREGILGAALTGMVILLFLKDWRSALIVVINIPLALLASVGCLHLCGQTINIMTLGGLALAVGILVDEAVVTIENIHTHHARGKSLAQAALDATQETTLPRLLALGCVLAVFTPTLFMTGAAKSLFAPLTLAVGFSMAASYLLSSTLVPVLSIWLLGRTHQDSQSFTFAKFQKSYASFLQSLMPVRWPLLIGYIAGTLFVIFVLGQLLDVEIFPHIDTGQIQVRFRAPTGTELNRTEAIAKEIADLIGKEVGGNNVAINLGFVGVQPPTYPINYIYLWSGGPEEGVLQVQLKSGTGIKVEDLQERLRKKIGEQLPNVQISFEPSDIVSRVMSFGAGTPVEIAVSGPSLSANKEYAEKIREKLAQIPSLRDLQLGQTLDYPTVDVSVNRERAGLMGVTISDATRSLLPATSSSRIVVPNYWSDPNTGISYQIQVQVPSAQMSSLEDVKNLPIADKTGKSILLRNVANVSGGTAVGQYERYNMQRMITLKANISGVDLGRINSQIRQAIRDAGNPPPKVNVAVRGQAVPLEQISNGLESGLALAIITIFLLLIANFQSWRLSLIVMAAIPAALTGIILALWITQTTLNLQSFMGAIMSIGVAVANAILLVTFAQRSLTGGEKSIQAAIEGAQSRLRPILMTSIAMIAGMIPMAIGFGETGGQIAPLGRAVIGGLTGATLATLIVLPSIFAAFFGNQTIHSISLEPIDSDDSLPSKKHKETVALEN